MYSERATCYRATCVRQHNIRIQVARPGNILLGNMLPWCKRDLTDELNAKIAGWTAYRIGRLGHIYFCLIQITECCICYC